MERPKTLVEPLSMNEFVERYGGGLAEFTAHCLAYFLQQKHLAEEHK